MDENNCLSDEFIHGARKRAKGKPVAYPKISITNYVEEPIFNAVGGVEKVNNVTFNLPTFFIVKINNLFIAVLFLFFLNASKAQVNLVPNPSFEDTVHCPNNVAQLNHTKKWYCPTTGTTDYFNMCSIFPPSYNNVGVPQNSIGYQNAIHCNAYIGVMACENVTWNGIYREYASIKLKSPLVAGIKYYGSFFVNLADSSRYATSRLGMLFSTDSITKSSWDTIGRIPQIENPFGFFLQDKVNWIQIKGSFVANGGEQFLTIGNFYDQLSTDTLFVSGGGSDRFWNFPYYFIDGVVVSTDSNYVLSNCLASTVTEHDASQCSIFPNPANNNLYVTLNSEEIVDILVMDLTGNIIDSANGIRYSKTFSIDNYSTGIYYIVIKFKQKNSLVHLKFLKL